MAPKICVRMHLNKGAPLLAALLVAALLVGVFVRPGARRREVCPCGGYVPVRRCVCNSDDGGGGGGGSASNGSCVTGRPCTYPDAVDLRVVVLTFNRPYSLSILLRSLDALVLDGNRAALEIWIDRDRNGSVDERTLDVASTFRWLGGITRVHVQVSAVSAREGGNSSRVPTFYDIAWVPHTFEGV